MSQLVRWAIEHRPGKFDPFYEQIAKAAPNGHDATEEEDEDE